MADVLPQPTPPVGGNGTATLDRRRVTLRRGSWRMKLGITLTRTGGLLALVLLGAARATGAQATIDPRCPAVVPNRAAQDACQKAIDIFAFMTPQLGIGLVGGNATLGTGGALGGVGRF